MEGGPTCRTLFLPLALWEEGALAAQTLRSTFWEKIGPQPLSSVRNQLSIQ